MGSLETGELVRTGVLETVITVTESSGSGIEFRYGEASFFADSPRLEPRFW